MLLMLDLFSTLCFAFVGASIALRLQMKLITVAISAVLPAMGGGTVREIILGSDTFFWITTPSYLLAILMALVIAVSLGRLKSLPKLISQMMDSLGTCVFTVVGVLAAIESGCSPFVVILLGMLTGIGGGLIREILFDRDALLQSAPRIVLAASVALLGSTLILFNADVIGTILLLALLHFGVAEIQCRKAGRKRDGHANMKLVKRYCRNLNTVDIVL